MALTLRVMTSLVVLWTTGTATCEPTSSAARVELGTVNRESRLRQLDHKPMHVSRIAEKGGRSCRATDLKNGTNFALDFDVDDAFLHDTKLPVKVTVEYFDTGTDWFRLRYDSTDRTALDYGQSKFSAAVQKTNSGHWQTATFALPDAKFAGRTPIGCDFSVDSCGDGDEYLASVQVVKGGLRLHVDPEAVAADGEAAVHAVAELYDELGQVAPDGTPVQFECSAGRIDPTATLRNGRAVVRYLGAVDPGTVTLTARSGREEASTDLHVLRGRGNLMEAQIRLGEITAPAEWRTAGCSLEAIPPANRPGARPTARLHYSFAHTREVHLTQRLPLPGKLIRLSLDARPDGSKNVVRFRVRDRANRLLTLTLGGLWKPQEGDWRQMYRLVGRGTRAETVRFTPESLLPIEPPLVFEGLTVGLAFWNRPPVKEGAFEVRELTAAVLVPESEIPPCLPRLSVREVPGGAYLTLTNQDTRKRAFSVTYKLLDESGKLAELGELWPAPETLEPGVPTTVFAELRKPHAPGPYALRLVAFNEDGERLTHVTEYEVREPRMAESAVTVVEATGPTEILRAGQRTWQRFEAGDPVAEHDLVRAAAGARLVLQSTLGVRAELPPEAVLELRAVGKNVLDPEAARLVVWRGTVRVVVPPGLRVVMMTPDAQFLATDAELRVSYERGKETRVQVSRGEAKHVETGKLCLPGKVYSVAAKK